MQEVVESPEEAEERKAATHEIMTVVHNTFWEDPGITSTEKVETDIAEEVDHLIANLERDPQSRQLTISGMVWQDYMDAMYEVDLDHWQDYMDAMYEVDLDW